MFGQVYNIPPYQNATFLVNDSSLIIGLLLKNVCIVANLFSILANRDVH
jgi:hypothetical protein